MLPSIRKLRKTREGRRRLSEEGRDTRNSQLNPSASLTRPFIAWDSEGITHTPGEAQSMVLWGCSAGHMLKGRDLRTIECFELMLMVEKEHPDAWHVGYSFTYDVSQLLRDVPEGVRQQLMNEGKARWGPYRLEYLPKKWFCVGKGPTTCKIWDVWSFFGGSFVSALREYLGQNPDFDLIEQDKGKRSEFQYQNLDSEIVPYWKKELDYTVKLMDALRQHLYSVGLHITSWHGPGAIASYKMKEEEMDRHMAITDSVRTKMELAEKKWGLRRGDIPEAVNDAAQYAFAGGRFEHFQLGRYVGKVYKYDINSAYPDAIRYLPSLSEGSWERTGVGVLKDIGKYPFAIYKVHMIHEDLEGVHPVFHRGKTGEITFPDETVGWYWAPDVASMLRTKNMKIQIQDGWVFHSDGSRPFSWITDVYNTRKKWKQEGNPAQLALKLLMNSMYGKMAQRVGWDEDHALPPRWHQLEYAGWITSWARAKLHQAILQAGDSIIATETDAIFTTKPLDLDVGSGLGQWDAEEYDEIIYLQSGVRYTRQGETWEKHVRGFEKESLGREEVSLMLRSMGTHTPVEERHLVGTTNRYVGVSMGLKRSGTWRRWLVEERTVDLGNVGKRKHVDALCPACEAGQSFYDGMHRLLAAQAHGPSKKHNIVWKNGLDESQEVWDSQWHEEQDGGAGWLPSHMEAASQ